VIITPAQHAGTAIMPAQHLQCKDAGGAGARPEQRVPGGRTSALSRRGCVCVGGGGEGLGHTADVTEFGAD
jgi:hypothetical protein